MNRLTLVQRKRALYAAALTTVLAGCASAPPDQFYTLTDSAGAPVPAAAPAPVYIEMRPVTVPDQVRRNQMVVAKGAGQVDLLEHHRWASKLDDQIRVALSLGIAAQLGAVDVYNNPAPPGAAVYRISASVQRFESRLDDYALVDVVWSVRRASEREVLTCRSVFREPVGAGHAALVAGHRAALARVSASIAAAVRGQASACAASDGAPA
ncbi:hypothetical protein IP91_04115 [Pseudoduganella lurida]|uniref:ABC-type transport auxiliary lipoprotein component domain-containing protein n=1 Tax=Pseudoduganella lurida TaxID=1036180 RepID=A0A562R1X6_9BURK|nr:PqiC family protein [Pseudoduganella lurida]TWI62594.1 hypothetical protein IP91_04115 [Pseudoduganella lurida]